MTWIETRAKAQLTARLRWEGAIWLALLGAWAPILAALASHHASTSTLIAVGVSSGALAILSTIVFGARLGWRRLWMAAWQAALAGGGVLVFWYSVVTLAAPDPQGQNDHSVGAGALILALPAVVAVAILLGCGYLLGYGVRSWRDR